MDLHFTNATATEEERSAVDEILNTQSGTLQPSTQSERFRKRHLLLPALHAVQSRAGWISPGAINYIGERLTAPPAEVYGVATFYALFSTEPQPPTVLHICDDIACKTRGADVLCAVLEANFGTMGTHCANGATTWKRSPCLGLCEKAPALLVQTSGRESSDFTIAPVSIEQLSTALRGETIDDSREVNGSTPQTGTNAPLQLLKRVGVVDPQSYEAYCGSGGYQALCRALEIGAEEVIRELSDARLTGRGGAAFPTGVKWKAVAGMAATPRYVVCNADESEPGTFKDRVIMEQDPFALIEAMTIAGFACGAEQGVIYIRGEYPEATSHLQNAIDRAKEAHALGANLLDSGVSFDIEIRRGAGAYICGEETALLNSIEGKRGEPRNKPPFPVQFGLFGKPTAINNVETLVNVLPILLEGGKRYSETGGGNSTGTRLFCLSGNVERPGVYEIPYGATLRSLIELAGGVSAGRELQAILLGGAAGVFVRPDELDIPLTLEGARAANATLGSGVVMLFDDTVDMRQILRRIAGFFRDESCGQCVPCRVGTVRQEEALYRLLTAEGDLKKELTLLAELEQVMKDASICGLGHTASSAISSAIHRLGVFQGVTE